MDTDDIFSPKTPATAASLEDMSIAALGEYIAALEAEIARVRGIIEAKQAVRGSAEGLFRR